MTARASFGYLRTPVELADALCIRIGDRVFAALTLQERSKITKQVKNMKNIVHVGEVVNCISEVVNRIGEVVNCIVEDVNCIGEVVSRIGKIGNLCPKKVESVCHLAKMIGNNL